MSKPKKILFITLPVLLLIAAVGLSVSFTFNTVRFSVMSEEFFENARSAYLSRTEGDSPVRFIAHRGLSAEAYQNTEKAFLLAGQEETVWGIETDVWFTNDGGIVCMHDGDAISGVGNVRNVTLEKATTTPLKNNKNEYAPTIQTYLGICKTYGKVAVVELKDGKISRGDVAAVLAAIKESGADAMIISFHYDLLKIVRELNPDIRLQALTASASFISEKQIDELIALRCDLSAYCQFINKSVADRFHNAGLAVGVWTVNSAKDALGLIGEFGVDYVTTDVRMAKEIAQFNA